MSDLDVQLISAGSLPMEGRLLGPEGTFADTQDLLERRPPPKRSADRPRRHGRGPARQRVGGGDQQPRRGARRARMRPRRHRHRRPHAPRLRPLRRRARRPGTAGRRHRRPRPSGHARSRPTAAPAGARGHRGTAWTRPTTAPRSSPGVRMVEAPGHRGGHACVEIGAERVAARVPRRRHPPSRATSSIPSGIASSTPTRTPASRRGAAGSASCRARGVACAASHIDGWGTIEPDGDGYRWQPAG